MNYQRIELSKCVNCGCDDMHACPNSCWWLEVDREKGIGVCSECGLKHDVRVFSIGDSEWWAGTGSPQAILDAYMKETGCTHEEATGDESELPQELTLLQLHQVSFTGGQARSSAKPETFFKALNKMVKSKASFPCSFACMD